MTVIVIEKKINVIVIDIILCNWTQPWFKLFACLSEMLLTECCNCEMFKCFSEMSYATFLSLLTTTNT